MPKNPPTGFASYPRLGDCAKANMLVVCRCARCQRTMTYLAGDLLDHFRWVDEQSAARSYSAPLTGFRIVGQLWGKCPRCGSAEYWSERVRYATGSDVGHLRIRRPAGFRQVRQWRDEWYEPQARMPLVQ